MKQLLANAYIAVLIGASFIMGGTLILHASEQREQTSAIDTDNEQHLIPINSGTSSQENSKAETSTNENNQNENADPQLITVSSTNATTTILTPTITPIPPQQPSGTTEHYSIKRAGGDDSGDDEEFSDHEDRDDD